jgi:hypothetical protein
MIEQHRFNVMSDRRIRLAEIAPLETLAWAPRVVGWRGVLTSAVVCAALFGLLVIGA